MKAEYERFVLVTAGRTKAVSRVFIQVGVTERFM